jgi:hypothetical protein
MANGARDRQARDRHRLAPTRLPAVVDLEEPAPRLAEIPIDHDHVLNRPAQRHRALAERVLALGTLRVFDDLSQRRLPHIQIRLAAQVARRDLLRSLTR